MILLYEAPNLMGEICTCFQGLSVYRRHGPAGPISNLMGEAPTGPRKLPLYRSW